MATYYALGDAPESPLGRGEIPPITSTELSFEHWFSLCWTYTITIKTWAFRPFWIDWMKDSDSTYDFVLTASPSIWTEVPKVPSFKFSNSFLRLEVAVESIFGG